MIKIRVLGLSDGVYRNEFSIEAKHFSDELQEYSEEVDIDTELKISSDRYNLKVKIDALANLVCDRSGEDFILNIIAETELIFQIDGNKVIYQDDNLTDSDLIKLKGNSIDIFNLVKEELILSIPIKRIKPEYLNKEFQEIYPEFHPEDDKIETESTWAKLKNINNN